MQLQQDNAERSGAPTEIEADPTALGAPVEAAPLAWRINKTVVLVGLMGAGKSSVGRRLAGRLGVALRDADTEIERAAGMTIEEIFTRHGEAHFRDGEQRVIARLLEDPPHVLATGGGAFIDARVRDAIAARGVSVWLKADLDELVRRTARRTHRPLLRQGDPRTILARLLEQRAPIYALADLSVASEATPDLTTTAVLAALAPKFSDPVQS
jgi:shikimate kinase